MALVSKAEFARRIGVSNAAVTKLCKTGRIPVKPNGKLDYEIALSAYNQTKQVGREKSATNGGKAPSSAPPQTTEDLPDDDAPMTGAGRIVTQYNKAKLVEKTYQAKLKQLEFEEKKEILVTRDAVQDDAAIAASELRNRLFSIPARAAVICEGKTAREIERIIENEINQVLEDLQSQFLNQQG